MDTRGPANSGSLPRRVLRGGSWHHNATYARSAKRDYLTPGHGNEFNNIGFRLALGRLSANPDAMVRIPAGTYRCGNVTGDSDMPDAPVQSVRVSEFYMQANLVTKARWDEVRTWGVANGYTDLAAGGGKASNHPVNRVTWYDVVKWANAASEMAGLKPCYNVKSGVYQDANGQFYALEGGVYRTGEAGFSMLLACDWTANGYRLPSELEWEVAARGGLVGKRFPWGDTITHSQANYFSSKFYSYDVSPTRGLHPSYWAGNDPYTSPAGSFPANGYGLFDMAGNVSQWCWDSKPGGYQEQRAFRGGGYNSSAWGLRCAKRYYIQKAEWANLALGFRLTRSRP
jgi:formylglycine-generating enzyme required for sulfatase activity